MVVVVGGVVMGRGCRRLRLTHRMGFARFSMNRVPALLPPSCTYLSTGLLRWWQGSIRLFSVPFPLFLFVRERIGGGNWYRRTLLSTAVQ